MDSYCIFCLKNVGFKSKNTAWRSGGDDLMLLERYLGGGVQFCPSLKSEICGTCAMLLDSFSGLYHRVKTLELEMEWNVMKLKDIVTCASRVPSRISFVREYYQGVERRIDLVHGWRDRFVRKCSKKLSSRFPRVSLGVLDLDDRATQQTPRLISERSERSSSSSGILSKLGGVSTLTPTHINSTCMSTTGCRENTENLFADELLEHQDDEINDTHPSVDIRTKRLITDTNGSGRPIKLEAPSNTFREHSQAGVTGKVAMQTRSQSHSSGLEVPESQELEQIEQLPLHVGKLMNNYGSPKLIIDTPPDEDEPLNLALSSGCLTKLKIETDVDVDRGRRMGFTCYQCGRQFGTQFHLKLHSLVHSSSDAMQVQCETKFISNSVLGRRIMKTHTRKATFGCGQRLNKYARGGDSRQHLVAIHKSIANTGEAFELEPLRISL